MAFAKPKGTLPAPPAANKQPADGGKHVPSSAPDSNVRDHSKSIQKHIEQTPQTVGSSRSDAPADEQASPQVAKGGRFPAGAPTGWSANQ